jgi:hypothetical protein
MGSKEPQPAPASRLCHEFDSSWTCNYCGVAQEKTKPGDLCQKRTWPTSPPAPHVSSSKLNRCVKESTLPNYSVPEDEEFFRFDMTARDEIASEIFIQWMEDISGQYESAETFKKLAENAVLAANLFIAELDAAKK